MSLWTPALTAAFEAAVVSPRVSLVVRPGDPAHAIVTGGACVVADAGLAHCAPLAADAGAEVGP